MGRAYGLPYQGSKSRIAEWVVDVLPASHTLVDLFAGGCAVTHAALMSGKWERVVANDRGSAPQVFLDACNGEFDQWALVCNRDDFMALRDVDEAVALLYSFGNDGRGYLWSEPNAAVKVPAEKMLAAPSERERRTWFKAFIKALMRDFGSDEKTNRQLGMERLERVQDLQGMMGLERVQGLQGMVGLERMQGLTVTRGDYRDVDVPEGGTVYADPPYRGTNTKKYGSFNFGAFDRWLAEVDFPVYVSEYTAPAGCVEVASREKMCSMSANGKSMRSVERIFVQERFAGSGGR